MCLILFAYNNHPLYRLVLAANRDEFYARPTRPLGFWKDNPFVLSGMDLEAGGTWMGVTKKGKFGAITNYRDPAGIIEGSPSRGLILKNYFLSRKSPHEYLEDLMVDGPRYNGFNLIIGDMESIWYFSNKQDKITRLEPGVYGLSNHLLDTPWPKTEKGKAGLALAIKKQEVCTEELFKVLSDGSFPPENKLPDTGIGRTWEKILSPVFIKSDIYGTRSSSIILVDKDRFVTFAERSFKRDNSGSLNHDTKRFQFKFIFV